MGLDPISWVYIIVFAAAAAVSYNGMQKAKRAAQQALERTRGLIYQSRAAAFPRRIIYGRRRVGGLEIFLGTSGAKNEYMHWIFYWCEGPVNSIAQLMFNGEVLPMEVDNPNGSDVQSGKYRGFATARHRRGDGGNFLPPDEPIAQLPGWAASDLGIGCAWSWVRVKYDENVFAQGFPDVSAVIEGRKDVYDPRDGLEKYTSNVGLCFNHYMTLPRLGPNIDYDEEMHEDELIACSNVCDELNQLNPPAVGFRRSGNVVIGENLVFMTTQDTSEMVDIVVGMAVSGPGIQPGTLVSGVHDGPGDFYFEIDQYPTSTVDASSLVFGDAESRYTINEVFSLEMDPESIIESFRSSMAGVAVYVSGRWRFYAGAYIEPTFEITKDMLIEEFRYRSKTSKRSHYNTIKGTYVAESNGFQPTDFDAVVNETYKTEDGEELTDDIDLSGTNSPNMARRIARIELERLRRSRTISCVLHIEGIRALPGRPVKFHFPEADPVFDHLPMDVLEYNFSIENNVCKIALLLRETSPDVYDDSDEDLGTGGVDNTGSSATIGPPPGGPGNGPDDPPLEYPDIFPPGVAGGISLSFECRSKGYTYEIQGFDEFLVSIPPKRFLQKQSSGSLSWCYYQHPGSVCNAVSEGSFKYDYAEHCTKDPVTLGVTSTGQRTLTAGNTACAFVGGTSTDNTGCGLTGIPGSVGPELDEGLTSTQWTLDGNGICATDFFRIGSGHAEVNLSAEDTDDAAVARAIADGGNVWGDWAFCLGGSSASWEQRGAGQYSASKLDGQIKVTGFVTFPNTTYTITFSFARTLIGGDGTIEDAGTAVASLSSGTSGEVEGIVDVPTTKGYYTFSTGWRLGAGDDE